MQRLEHELVGFVHVARIAPYDVDDVVWCIFFCGWEGSVAIAVRRANELASHLESSREKIHGACTTPFAGDRAISNFPSTIRPDGLSGPNGIYNRVNTSEAAMGNRRPSSNSTRSFRLRISWQEPFLAFFRHHPATDWWQFLLKFLIHILLETKAALEPPASPEIFDGSRVDFCNFAMRIETGGMTAICVLQQTGLPQSP